MVHRLFDLLSRDKMCVAGLEAIFTAMQPMADVGIPALWAVRQLDADKAWRAVWLLKRLTRERGLTEFELVQLAEAAGGLDHWLARLTVCQVFAGCVCPASARAAWFAFLHDCARDRHVIVRAWALTALAQFRDDPVHGREVDFLLEAARHEPAKAMRARLRHLPSARPGPSPRRRRRAALIASTVARRRFLF